MVIRDTALQLFELLIFTYCLKLLIHSYRPWQLACDTGTHLRVGILLPAHIGALCCYVGIMNLYIHLPFSAIMGNLSQIIL